MLKIGSLEIKYRAMLSPLASLTDIAFRRLVDEIGGAGYMVTEMISAEGIRRRGEKTLAMIKTFAAQTPQFIQLFGAQPGEFVEAVKYIENETDYAGVDINMGCPAQKVVRKDAGAALLKDPARAARIVREVKRSSRLPLTVKIRLGYETVNVFEIARILDQEGVDAIVVHFRLKEEGYRGRANWDYAPFLREWIDTVLIGNGDITTARQAREKLEIVAGVMIGRAAIANPLIFAEIAEEEEGRGEGGWQRARLVRRLLELITEHYPPEMRLNRVKAFARFLFSGQKYAKRARRKVYDADTFAEARAHIEALLDIE